MLNSSAKDVCAVSLGDGSLTDQNSFVAQLLDGEMPMNERARYDDFINKVGSDHLVHIIFGCGCWRFIEVRAIYKGPGFNRNPVSRVIMQHMKYEYLWNYYYPTTKVQCGARVVDESWFRRRLKVFSLRVGYTHHYTDHIFRERAEAEIKKQVEILISPS